MRICFWRLKCKIAQTHSLTTSQRGYVYLFPIFSFLPEPRCSDHFFGGAVEMDPPSLPQRPTHLHIRSFALLSF